MGYEYKGGGVEAIVMLTDPLGANKEAAETKFHQVKEEIRLWADEVPTIGLESIFGIENPVYLDEYLSLVGSFPIGSYPVFDRTQRDFAKQEHFNSIHPMWRLYTLVRIMQLLNATIDEHYEAYISRNALAAIDNCSSSDMNVILGEFSTSGKAHAQLVHKVTSNKKDKSDRGAVYFTLASPSFVYVDVMRKKLRQFSALLNKYDNFLYEKANEAMHDGFVKTHVRTERKKGKFVTYHKINTTQQASQRLKEQYLSEAFKIINSSR